MKDGTVVASTSWQTVISDQAGHLGTADAKIRVNTSTLSDAGVYLVTINSTPYDEYPSPQKIVFEIIIHTSPCVNNIIGGATLPNMNYVINPAATAET